MAKVTVKQLAETVKVPVDRLLKQMQEAGLSHSADAVSYTHLTLPTTPYV